MCYALYIGTDRALPTEDDVEAGDRFHLQPLDTKDAPVRDKFSKPYVTYAASWQGCGCGWLGVESALRSKRGRVEDREKTRRCMRDLEQVLSDEVDASSSVELFLCWEGSQGEQPKRRISLSLCDFEGDMLPMDELDFAVVGG